MWESTAFPEGAPHLIDRLDAAIADGDRAIRRTGLDYGVRTAIDELLSAAREARAALKEYR